jgi:hypothetical protein
LGGGWRGRGKPQITETADTELAETGAQLYYSFSTVYYKYESYICGDENFFEELYISLYQTLETRQESPFA